MAQQHEEGLSEDEQLKLVAILSRLGSSFAGERDAAGLAAVRFLNTRKLTWEMVIIPPPVVTARHATWQSVARACLSRAGLTDKERHFLDNLLTAFASPSVKQAAWLDAIARRTGITP